MPEDLDPYRREFPIADRFTYFNHASVSPLPARSASAIKDLAEEVMLNGSLQHSRWVEVYGKVRSAAAQLLGCFSNEVALVKNTSEGLSFVANGLDWRPGDVVVGIEDEFPANYFPWLRLERQGVQLRWLRLRDGRLELEEIDRACRGARLLAISWVQYLSGFRIDLDAVGEICRRHGTLLVVDGVQGLGPFPVDVKRSGIHAFSASGHKWLLGPEGCGILYIDQDLQPEIEPVEFGWTNVEGWRTYSHDPTLRKDAARYECGTLNTAGYCGLKESLELFLEIGVERIARQVDRLADQIVEGARAKGYHPVTPRNAHCGSGIVSIRKQAVPSEEVVQKLRDNRVITSLRFGWVRASPHFYSTEEDVERFLDLLI